MAANESNTPPFPAQEPEYIDLRACLFSQAAPAWLESRRPYISPATFRDYTVYIRTLGKFVGELRLNDIGPEDIRRYQRSRMETVGPSIINKETSVIQQLLKRVGRWPVVAEHYQALPVSQESRGRALSDDERTRLFVAASSQPRWQGAYLFALISVNTSGGPKEILTLRRRDIDLGNATISIQPEGAKNPYRVRVIPLNVEALDAIEKALARAASLGAIAPDHYLFPFRLKRSAYDPTRHQRSCKKAWMEITAAAGLNGFRMYDLRHTAISRLLENPEISEETCESLAGHISHRMKKRYSHIRLEVRRAAVAAIAKPLEAAAELHNEDVLGMLQDGFSPEVVTAKIKASRCRFDTTLNTLRQLKASAIPQTIILAMVRAS